MLQLYCLYFLDKQKGTMRGSIEDFGQWHTHKVNIAHRGTQGVPTINEREVWWCSIGMNVGGEEYVKGLHGKNTS